MRLLGSAWEAEKVFFSFDQPRSLDMMIQRTMLWLLVWPLMALGQNAWAQRDESTGPDRPQAKVPSERNEAEEAERAAEERAEMAEAMSREWAAKSEEWAAEHEQRFQEWADRQSERWEEWAERYEAQWEEWAHEQEQVWEDWSEQYSRRWEEWAESLETGNLAPEDLKNLWKENMQLLGEMPLPQLYEGILQHTAELKDAPWKELADLEPLIRDSLEDAMNEISELQSGDAKTEDLRDREANLKQARQSLEKMRASLDQARKQLDKSAREQIDRLRKELKLAEKVGQGDPPTELDDDAKAALKRHDRRSELEKRDAELEELRQEIKALRAELEEAKRNKDG
jgi:hypothetical protein